MMKAIFLCSTVGALALVAAMPGVAHHSAAMFDMTKSVTITGTVKEFQYTNPHSWLLVSTKGADGKEVTWGFEAEGPSSLMRAGIRKSDLAPGTEVTITGNPMADGRPAATWGSATRLSDKKAFSPRGGLVPK